jgi:hypothetical protein
MQGFFLLLWPLDSSTSNYKCLIVNIILVVSYAPFFIFFFLVVFIFLLIWVIVVSPKNILYRLYTILIYLKQ